MRIKFLSDQVYETEGPGKGPAFHAGELIDCVDDFAHRWINRGVAEAHGEGAPADGEKFSRLKVKAAPAVTAAAAIKPPEPAKATVAPAAPPQAAGKPGELKLDPK